MIYIFWLRPESNRDYTLRRGVSYPLNDGIIFLFFLPYIHSFERRNHILILFTLYPLLWTTESYSYICFYYNSLFHNPSNNKVILQYILMVK